MIEAQKAFDKGSQALPEYAALPQWRAAGKAACGPGVGPLGDYSIRFFGWPDGYDV
jgi:hypothetical protein